MENLFRAADYATRYILGRKRIRLKTTEEWTELHALCMYKAVFEFMKRLRDHEYNRDYSFFENVYSCVWSSHMHVVDAFIKDIKRHLSSTDNMDMVAYNPDQHPLRVEPSRNIWGILTRAERESLELPKIKLYNAEEALNYLWACEDEAAAYEGTVIDHAANLEHRKHVLERIKAKENEVDPQRLHQRKYLREYRRKARAAAARR